MRVTLVKIVQGEYLSCQKCGTILNEGLYALLYYNTIQYAYDAELPQGITNHNIQCIHCSGIEVPGEDR